MFLSDRLEGKKENDFLIRQSSITSCTQEFLLTARNTKAGEKVE